MLLRVAPAAQGHLFCNASPFRAQHELYPDFFEGNASPHFCKHTVRFRFYNLYAKNRKGKMDMLKKYFFYLIRWQLSTPILTVVLLLLSGMNTLWATVIANLIGGLIFFWVDKFIFKKISRKPVWEIEEDVTCADCGRVGTGYRITEWLGYDRTNDQAPQFRCEACRKAKMEEVSRKIKRKAPGKQ